MGGSGLEDLWETVYVPNIVIHMMTGYLYARAFIFLSSVAIVSKLLQTLGCLSSMNLTRVQAVHKQLLDGKFPTDLVNNDKFVQKLINIMDSLMEDAVTQSRMGKLWVEYLKHISLIKHLSRVH
jgi:hypothetical protein